MKKDIPVFLITAIGAILTVIGVLDGSVSLAVVGVALVALVWINKHWFK